MTTFTILERIVSEREDGKIQTLGYKVEILKRVGFRSVENVVMDLIGGNYSYLTQNGAEVILRITTKGNSDPEDNLSALPVSDADPGSLPTL